MIDLGIGYGWEVSWTFLPTPEDDDEPPLRRASLLQGGGALHYRRHDSTLTIVYSSWTVNE